MFPLKLLARYFVFVSIVHGACPVLPYCSNKLQKAPPATTGFQVHHSPTLDQKSFCMVSKTWLSTFAPRKHREQRSQAPEVLRNFQKHSSTRMLIDALPRVSKGFAAWETLRSPSREDWNRGHLMSREWCVVYAEFSECLEGASLVLSRTFQLLRVGGIVCR